MVMFQAYIYVCIHTFVGNISINFPNIRWMMYIHTGIYTWSCYFLLLHLDCSRNQFSTRNDLFHVNCATSPYRPFFEKSGPDLKVHLLTDFPTFFLAVGFSPSKNQPVPSNSGRTDWHRLVHFIPVRAPMPLSTHTWAYYI